MKVGLEEHVKDNFVRQFPYVPGGVGTYYDFKKHPELIPTVLEDFKAQESHETVQSFFDLLRWLNGPNSRFETTDCAFRGPAPNSGSTVQKAFRSSGRLMVIFRDLRRNVRQEDMIALRYSIRRTLQMIDPDFQWGFVRICRSWACFSELDLPESERNGEETELQFWAWGDDERETMENLKRVFVNLRKCLEVLSEDFARKGY